MREFAPTAEAFGWFRGMELPRKLSYRRGEG